MNTQRHDLASAHAGRIIATFLEEKGSPSAADWKVLIEKYPQHAADIADAAMLSRSARPLAEEDLNGKVNQEVYEAGVSKALNLLHATPAAVLVDLEKKVDAARGPAVRKLAPEVGLAAAHGLLSGILVGSIEAPKQVLSRLASKFETSAMALVEVFRRAFENRELPAYKAQDGKPVVIGAPMSWEEAVKASGLSESQARELLKLDE